MKAIKVVAVSAAGLSAMVAVVVGGQMGSVVADSELKAEAETAANGNLHVPDAYRTTYQFLGAWAVAADQGQGSGELHVVYASPGTITAYRKDGHFPDGAVLVKEVYRAATGQMTTGTVSHADSLRGWFVMMKDSNGRYAGNDSWGDGWGWSWFDLPVGWWNATSLVPRARARARRVVPISELVLGVLTQNPNSLEPSLGFAAIARHAACGSCTIPYKKEPMRDPKRLWRIKPTLCRSRLPPARSTAKALPFSMRGVPAIAANPGVRLEELLVC